MHRHLVYPSRTLLISTLSALALTLAVTTQANAQTHSPETVRQAVESLKTCDQFLRVDSDFIAAGLPSGQAQLTRIDDPKTVQTFATSDRAVDAARMGDELWLLTNSGLEEWAIASGERIATYPTYKADRRPSKWEHPSAMAVSGETLVIAHEAWGYSVFDTKTKSLVHSERLAMVQAPLESIATGVTVIGHDAFVVMDSLSLAREGEKQAFRGLIKIDLHTNRVVGQYDGLDVGADALVNDGKTLYVSFQGLPIWSYRVSTLRGTRLPNPKARVWQYSSQQLLAGHPTGQASLDSKYYYTCFSAQPQHRGDRYHRVPAALDRAALHLD